MSDKVVLAYSGGLDTSVVIRWIKEKHGLDTIAVNINVGEARDAKALEKKALDVGAIKAYVIDAKEEFIRDYAFPALKANALYQGVYPLATALARPLMAKRLVEVALAEGARVVAHGCTGKGNDQVRFEVGVNSLAPQLDILAPAREWGMTREETIAYAQEHGIPVPVTSQSPYSLDENLWGKAIECGVLEDPWTEPPDDAFTMTVSPKDAPDEAEYVEISFIKGVPVALNGTKMGGVALVNSLNEIAGRHGVGRIDHIEDRMVGIKSREVYEAPAALVLIQAHQALEALTLSRDQLRSKAKISQEYADIIYNGLWFTALRRDLAAYVDSSQVAVTGEVRCKLYKGGMIVVGRRSPHSLYSHGLATYDKGDEFDQSAAAGFIHLWGLSAKTEAQVRSEEEGNRRD